MTSAGQSEDAAKDDVRQNKRQRKNEEDGAKQSKDGKQQRPDRRRDRNKGGNYRLDRGVPNSNGQGVPAEADEGAGEESGSRLPKRKVAVAFGYCGIGYSGLQINPGVKTIEGDIFDCFCQVGAVSRDNAVNPTKVGLQRAARTDRGVHAAGNLMSLKLILEPPSLQDEEAGDMAGILESATTLQQAAATSESEQEGAALIRKVNSMLPEFIRIWGITRIQNSFDARVSCDSRMYEYLLPTYVFLPPKPGSAMYEMLAKMRDEEKSRKQDGAEAATGGSDFDPSSPNQTPNGELVPSWDEILKHPFWEHQGTSHTFTEDLLEKKKWRMPKEKLERIKKIFGQYHGAHNFHNFTVGKEFRERSAHRFMKKLSISDPMMIKDTEWVSIKLHGQSFMLHQIRKMIGLLVLVGRTNAPSSLILETYGPARVHVPKAPGLGLLLEHPVFDTYNKRIQGSNKGIQNKMEKLKGDVEEIERLQLGQQLREPVEYTAYEADMVTFKQKFIYDRIFSTEEETAEFGKWLNYLDVFSGSDFEYLNPKGVIPQSCLLKLGEHRREHKPKGAQGQADSAHDPDSDDEDTEALLKGNQAELDG
ncbi:pseudouridine synthase [Tilletiaria anomala UBC 951]|uniref:Pseudouridine synthase n=1 Tax=Tilletiaria anomala (strain ATCC 24038 / CBS 436.72 / UBC 951) TaxID=1037660 RepID=A0A066VX81_TILAU|nr:pseudouridine synthase [Tilletiaria anomala UBC 951]KDN46106.1 pseudouridine synthase [Tilletiaria anomala UBC 951]